MNRFSESKSLKIVLLVSVCLLAAGGGIRSCVATIKPPTQASYPGEQRVTSTIRSGESLDIRTLGTDVLVRIGDSSSELVAEVQGNRTTNHQLQVHQDGSTWTITFRPSWNPVSFNSGSSNAPLIVTIPAGLILEDISITTISGDISVENSLETTDSATFKTTSGDIRLAGLNTEKAEVKSVSGIIQIHSLSTDRMEATTVSDRIEMEEISPKFSKIEARSTSGNINLTFTSQPSMTIRMKSLSGRLALQGARGSSSMEHSYGRSSAEVDLGTTSGNISVAW